MSGFAAPLRAVASRVPEVQFLIVMGTDGIPIEKLVLRTEGSLDAMAAEYTALLRASAAAAASTGMGALRDVTVVGERLVAVLVPITPDYFLLAALAPGAMIGRARFALRMAGETLQREFV